MSFIDKYYKNLPKQDFEDLEYEDQVKVLTYIVAKELPFVWTELDKERNVKREAKARSIVLNEKGRSGSRGMTKYTSEAIESMPVEEVGNDILSLSLETLNRMLKDIIMNGKNDVKARKFANTLDSREGCITLFKTQMICSAELIIEKGISIKNGAFLESRIQAKNKAKARIAKLYRNFYADEITWEVLNESVEEILNGFSKEFLMTNDLMDDAADEKIAYNMTDKETIIDYMHGQVDSIREMVRGQIKLFLM